MRHDEPDEADDARLCDERRDGERRGGDGGKLEFFHRDAERMGFALSEQENVELVPHELKEGEDAETDDRGERQISPLDAGETTEQPTHRAAHLCLVVRTVDDEHRQRREERRHAHADKNELRRVAAFTDEEDRQHSGDGRAEESAERYGVRAEEGKRSPNDRADRARTRARGDAEHIRVGQFIARDGLEQQPRKREPRARQHRE